MGRAIQVIPALSPEIILSAQQSTQETQLEEVSILTGRLKHFSENWKTVTSDGFILDTIAAFKIPFKTEIRQTQPPCEPSWSNNEMEAVTEQINKLLQKGAIRKCDAKDG